MWFERMRDSMIVRDRGGLHGITTAATVWRVTGIGMHR